MLNGKLTQCMLLLEKFTTESVSAIGSDNIEVTPAELEQLNQISMLADGIATVLNRQRTMLS